MWYKIIILSKNTNTKILVRLVLPSSFGEMQNPILYYILILDHSNSYKTKNHQCSCGHPKLNTLTKIFVICFLIAKSYLIKRERMDLFDDDSLSSLKADRVVVIKYS